MQQLISVKWCDYPGCPDAQDKSNGGQPVETYELLVYIPRSKGHKPNSIYIDLCEKHGTELYDLYRSMKKFSSKTT